MKTEDVKLGDKLKDIVTKIEGVCIGKTKWITGCDHVHLQFLDKDGKLQQESFDVTRVEYVDSKVHDKLAATEKKEVKTPKKPGGPSQRKITM